MRVSFKKKLNVPVNLSAPQENYTTGSKSILTGLADCLPERCFEERYMD